MNFMLITTPSSYPALHQTSADVTAWSWPPPPAQAGPSSPGHGRIPALRPQAHVSLLPWASLSLSLPHRAKGPSSATGQSPNVQFIPGPLALNNWEF